MEDEKELGLLCIAGSLVLYVGLPIVLLAWLLT